MGLIVEIQKNSELFLNNIYALPLWVRQVVYLKTEQRLSEELDDFLELLSPKEPLQFLVPELTFKGKRELEERAHNFSEQFYVFLENCKDGFDIFEITLRNFWTLSETAGIFVRAVEKEYIEIPSCESNYVIIQFLANKIRTGELLKRLGKIDVIQLENAIREQKKRAEAGNNTRIADVMIELGYITEKDVKIILLFKDESKKRFIMSLGLASLKMDNPATVSQVYQNMQKELKRLEQENRILKARLKKLLNIQ